MGHGPVVDHQDIDPAQPCEQIAKASGVSYATEALHNYKEVAIVSFL
jgi:hypothetical protein